MNRFEENLTALNEKRWSKIQEQVARLGDHTGKNNEQIDSEHDRLVRIVDYICGTLASIQPFADLMNQDIQSRVTNFENRFKQSRKLQPNQLAAVLTNLNNEATSILERISPFITNLDSARSAGQAFGRYRTQIENESERLRNILSAAQKAISEIELTETKAHDYRAKLLEGSANSTSIAQDIDAAATKIDQMLAKTETFYGKLTAGDGDIASIQSQISQAKTSAVDSSDEIAKLLSTASQRIEALEEIHRKVFGETVEGEATFLGLEAELNERKGQLNSLVGGFEDKFRGLFEQVEGLLPGATSAGLATRFEGLHRNASKREMRYSIAFYFGIAALIVSAFATVTETFVLWPLSWEQTAFNDAGEYLNKLLFKLPFVVPVLWFTLNVGKRRSEMHRLAEEYAHKEALATSYEGFKKQIIELNREGDPLMSELLEKVLSAISANSAKTLEGKHAEKMPIQEIVEEVAKKSLANGT